MEYGFGLPTQTPLGTAENLTRLASEAEKIGYAYVTVSDHLVIPRDIAAKYPYSETGEFTGRGNAFWHEQLTAIAFLSARTSKIKFHTSVMVVPHRPAVLTAKILSTIDVLSGGGRLSLGIGAGWMKEEFEAIGAQSFEHRGTVTDEYIQAFRELWTKDAPRMNGTYVKFDNIMYEPKPNAPIPIWVGGESGPALRRAATLGDGWYPIGVNPQFPLDTLPRYRASVQRVRQLAGQAGRDPASVKLAYRTFETCVAPAAKASDGERKMFTGSVADVAGDIHALQDLGVTRIDVRAGGSTVDAILENAGRLMGDVLAKA
jgi:probable F420-dependent oxidoreductase